MFQEVKTVVLTDHLNTYFTKPSRVVGFFVCLFQNLSFVEIKEPFSAQEKMFCILTKVMLNLGEVYMFIYRYHPFLSLKNSTHLN